MPIQWTGLSPELLVPIDRDQRESLRSQIERGLREAIRTGRLEAGERLPSSREFARVLGVSRGLVIECYGQLQGEGYLTSQVGSATRVASRGIAVSPRSTGPAAPGQRLTVDFLPGVPDLASFPGTDWLWAQREAYRRASASALNYGDPRGAPELRHVLAGYARRVRAAAADPEHIVVCNGFTQGLNLVLSALADCGLRTVAFEDPGYDETVAAATARAGVGACPVPVDELGLRVDALEASAARVAVLTPAHQWPTGVVLAAERRLALVDWANRHQAVIVEDDYDAEFRYDRDPVGALQGLAPERVVALGTVSKSLAPALRLGWMLCPSWLTDAVREQKRREDRGSAGLEQLALAALIESGRFDRHLRRMRTLYAHRRAALVDALAEHAPLVELSGLAAGFHAVAHLPEGTDEKRVVAEARGRSVGLYGMSAQRSDKHTTPTQLLLGFGNTGERAIRTGIAAIGDLLNGH